MWRSPAWSSVAAVSGSALVVVDEILTTARISACQAERATVCWGSPPSHALLWLGAFLLFGACGVTSPERLRRIRRRDVLVLLGASLLAIVPGFWALDALNTDVVYDARETPIYVVFWLVPPAAATLAYGAIARITVPATLLLAVASTAFTYVAPFAFLFVLAPLSSGA